MNVPSLLLFAAIIGLSVDTLIFGVNVMLILYRFNASKSRFTFNVVALNCTYIVSLIAVKSTNELLLTYVM